MPRYSPKFLARPILRRGTLRAPGSDLRKLPVGLDFAGISVAEGLRAAVASGAVLVLNAWVQSPALLFVAFAANLTCFCDIGGALRERVPALLAFTVLAAVLWSGLGLLHDAGLPLLLPASGLVVFCNAMARVWGARATAVGNVLTVVLALAVDRALPPAEAGILFVAFLIGGAWAVLMTLGIWRIHPERAGSRMVAENWRLLAAFTRDLATLLRGRPDGPPGGPDLADFEAHARAHRRALRQALEETRGALLATARPQGLAGSIVARNILAVEDQDRIFGALIALSDMLEYAEDPDGRAAAARMLRRLSPLLDRSQVAWAGPRNLARFRVKTRKDRLGQPTRSSPGGRPAPRMRGIEPALARLTAAAAGHPALANLAAVLADRLRIADRLKAEEAGLDLPDPPPPPGAGLDAWIVPLRANLTWSSAILRHAVRAAALTVAAVAVSLTWWSVYSHWLTITVALTMQPFFAATWQRALERIGGTVLGALIGGALAFFPQTPLADSLLMIPLSVIGFSVRQVSYGAYIACLTPLVVILFDVAEPGHAEWLIATMRTLYTIGGGVVAVLACMVLWPSWEPDRTAQGLRDALDAHARYAAAVLAARAGAGEPAAVDVARRAAGVSSNNLEASLSRALQEPGRAHRRRLEAIMAADAGLRRLGGALIALQHDAQAGDGLPQGGWDAWSRWLPEALHRLATPGGAPAGTPPPAPPSGTLARIGRVVEVLGDIVADGTAVAAATTGGPGR